jgi:hypothetical protein
MINRRCLKPLSSLSAFAAVFALGMSLSPTPGRADNDNNGAQDEKQMIQTGLMVAATSGIQLNTAGKDLDMVGLGSYLVNVVSDCNGCHTQDPSTEFLPYGNPYLLMPPNGPFAGIKKINPATYLGGGSDFGVFPSPGGTVHIISRNLTPGKSGMPEGDHTLAQFMQILRTGVDLDHAHPNCSNTITTNCPFAPFNGDVLQVMPWPNFQNMTDRQITAIYTYLSAVPCLEGGPGEKPGRCR